MDFRRLHLEEVAPTTPQVSQQVSAPAKEDEEKGDNWASKLAFGLAIVTLLGFTALTVHAMVTRSHVTKLMGTTLKESRIGKAMEAKWTSGKSKGADEVCKRSKMIIVAVLGLFLTFNTCFSAAIADPVVTLDENPEATRGLRRATVGMNAASLVMLLFYIVWYVWRPLKKRCEFMQTTVSGKPVWGRRVKSPPPAEQQ